MSRSGYSDDCENLWLYRQAVRQAVRGKRGRALLQDLATALDLMPRKRLVAGHLVDSDGEVCALGALGCTRDLPMVTLDTSDRAMLANAFQVAPSLVAEIMFENDEAFDDATPEDRWRRMRRWVAAMLATGDPG